MTIGPQDDLVSLLTQDHKAVEQRFGELFSAGENVRAELFWKLTDQLVRHEVAEETIVYPVLRQHPGGGPIAESRLSEQAEAEKQLAELEKLDPKSEQFVGAARDFEKAVLAHAQAEETEAFPLLIAHEDNASLLLLGQKYKGAKLAAPNHPHPHLPNTAAANKMLGPVAAFFDRVRDSFTGKQ